MFAIILSYSMCTYICMCIVISYMRVYVYMYVCIYIYIYTIVYMCLLQRRNAETRHPLKPSARSLQRWNAEARRHRKLSKDKRNIIRCLV